MLTGNGTSATWSDGDKPRRRDLACCALIQNWLPLRQESFYINPMMTFHKARMLTALLPVKDPWRYSGKQAVITETS